jgi:hypothetical protein
MINLFVLVFTGLKNDSVILRGEKSGNEVEFIIGDL